MTVTGIKRVVYTKKTDNTLVSGNTYFCTYQDNKIDGFGCKEIYVSDKVLNNPMCYNPQIGDEIDFFYNQYKSPSLIFKIEG